MGTDEKHIMLWTHNNQNWSFLVCLTIISKKNHVPCVDYETLSNCDWWLELNYRVNYSLFICYMYTNHLNSSGMYFSVIEYKIMGTLNSYNQEMPDDRKFLIKNIWISVTNIWRNIQFVFHYTNRIKSCKKNIYFINNIWSVCS